jgi:hypothetical protein
VKNQTKLSRRGLLAHVSVVAATMAPVATIALGGLPAGDAALSGADPIFAVIAEHKAAVEACIAPDAEAKSEEALDYEGAAFKTLFTTVPTTVAGVAAWLQHLASSGHPGGHSIVATIGQYYDVEFQDVVTRQLLAMAAVLTGAQAGGADAAAHSASPANLLI